MCGVTGSVPWLVGIPPAESWGYVVPRSGFVGWARGGLHLFMCRGSGDNLTVESAPQDVMEGDPKTPPGSRALVFVLAKGVWTPSTHTSAYGRAPAALIDAEILQEKASGLWDRRPRLEPDWTIECGRGAAGSADIQAADECPVLLSLTARIDESRTVVRNTGIDMLLTCPKRPPAVRLVVV